MKIEPWKTVPIERAENFSWALLKNNTIMEYESLEKLRVRLKNWSPVYPILVSKAGETCFLPPGEHTELNSIFKKYKISLKISLFLFLFSTAILLINTLITHSLILIKGCILFALFSAYVYCDFYISRYKTDLLSERSLFFYWLFNSQAPKNGFHISLVVMLIPASIQWLLIKVHGSIDDAYLMLGAVHEKILDGEVWRLITGPFLHGSIAHFLNNFLFMIIIGPMLWGLYQTRTILIFIIGNALGVIASTVQFSIISNYPFVAYGGVSSGIFALFGYVIANSMIDKEKLPQYMNIQLFLLSVVSIYAADIFSKNAATVSHIIGFLFGIISGLLPFKATDKNSV